MAEAVTIETQARQTRGTQAARKLRRKGLVPGVVYGHKEDPVSVAMAGDELAKIIRHGVRVVDLKTDGKTQKTLIREVQWDHLGKELLHVDFARIAADERVAVTVPVALRGTAIGVTHGGVLDQPMHTLHIECLAVEVPESIRVNIAELEVGSTIHVKDLVLPPGVKVLAEPDAVVVHVTAKAADEEAPVAPVSDQAEPELIGRQKPAEEEAE